MRHISSDILTYCVITFNFPFEYIKALQKKLGKMVFEFTRKVMF